MKRTLGVIAVYLVAIAGISTLAYGVISLVVNTDVERRLIEQNRQYSQLYPKMVEKQKLLLEAAAALQYKDEEIYNEIFQSPAPVLDPAGNLDLSSLNDTIPEHQIEMDVYSRSASLSDRAGTVERNFEKIFYALADRKTAVPPMISPVKGIGYAQIGASVGVKSNPSYKTSVQHRGLDIIASQGTPVLATAPGVVVTIRHSSKGEGNEVEILHKGLYLTCYAHLASVYVRMGQAVKAGNVIGSVGMSGISFAPHLHYEVHRDGKIIDPANCLFASFSPYDYTNVLYMAANTQQSMD